ncbi:MAG: hypothetical protein B7Z55_16615 [Planctomycetales bacterium 12-60-4]|nr:MAG: hypothetical protein B7Z55_16615 [Planctomycetales bacterium 12-60-4]
MVASRFLFGLAQAGLVPNQAQALQSWIPDSGRGLASSVLVVAMSGGAIASLALTGLLMTHFHWRTIFMAYGLATFAWAALFWLCYRNSPVGKRSLDDDSSVNELLPAPRLQRNLPLSLLLLNCSVWGLSLQALFKTAGYNFLVTFLPTYLEYAHGVSAEQTGALASWSLLAVMGGSLLGGILLDLGAAAPSVRARWLPRQAPLSHQCSAPRRIPWQ